jgi:hypothetical protein
MSGARERAIGRAFSDLRAAPGFRGAVILYLTEDGGGLVIKSTLPAHLVEKLLQEAGAFTRGERGNIVVGGN